MLNTGDQSLIKNLNRRILLEKIIEYQNISRAHLSKITGLNKATVTSQINELINDGLVEETEFDKSSGGRKPILLRLKSSAGYAIGVELDIDKISLCLTDLNGRMVNSILIETDTSSFDETKLALAEQIQGMIKQAPESRYGIIGICIGIHGLVQKNEKIVFATHSKWKDVDLKLYLSQVFDIPIYIENNTNLCAYAEKAFYVNDSNLLCLSISTGIGLGIIIDNTLYKGLNGFAGEIGHMIIQREGRQCNCGNKGCWEQYVSDRVFFEAFKVMKKTTHSSVQDIQSMIEQGDRETLGLIQEFSENLVIGINNVINIFNPETIILNSQIISICPEIIENIKKSLVSSMSDFRTILPSRLGKDACTLGASAVAITNFLNVNDLRLNVESI